MGRMRIMINAFIAVAVTVQAYGAGLMPEKTPGGDPSRLIKHLEAGVSQKLVFYGTSLTAAGDWTKQLQAELESRYGPLISVRNRARSGQDSSWGLAHVERRVEWKESRPDLFALHVADGVHPDAEAAHFDVMKWKKQSK